MKTFINVLYRRILYKIPLKLLLVLLAVFGVLFASFSNADYVEDLVTNLSSDSVTVNSNSTRVIYNIQGDYGTYCVKVKSFTFNGQNFSSLKFGYSSDGAFNSNNSFNLYTDWATPFYVCLYSNKNYFYFYNSNSSSINISYEFFKLNALFNTQIPVYTSLECQTYYNLIPISSVDQNYCTSNNLCPSVPSGTGNLTQLYINNILHVGAPTILMNISEEIDWDYAYTQGGNIMNIDVVGYNVDYQAVEDEIIIQKYKPNSEELSGIISGLIPLFVPGLCIILLLYFIFKFIKKVF